MTPYKNSSGDSNVESYEYTPATFIVKFNGGAHYLYSTNSNDLSEIQKMQKLADVGTGLGAMLATKPYHLHDKKW